jgi:hypothetical protein
MEPDPNLHLGDGLHMRALLLLGPLFHLDRRKDRLRALAETLRVVRPGCSADLG